MFNDVSVSNIALCLYNMASFPSLRDGHAENVPMS